MTIEQEAHETDTPFAEKLRERILLWIKAAGGAPDSFSVRLRHMVAGIRKSSWVAFAIMLAANIIAFSYYQERITRYYLSVLLANLVRINGDMDALEAKINQLNQKTDDLSAKLGKPSSSSGISTSPSSNSAKPRSR